MSLSAMQMQPLDVMQFTFSAMGWNNKMLEITGASSGIYLPNAPNFAGIGMNVNNAGAVLAALAMECFSFTLTQP